MGPKPNQTILIVEDDEITRTVLQRRLEAKGYMVLAVSGGRQALETVERQPVDLVLLDTVMPEMDGLEVLERLREKRTATDLPIIMVTYKESSSDVVRALRLGANDYVAKSLDFEVILARVRTHLLLLTLTRHVEHLKNTSL